MIDGLDDRGRGEPPATPIQHLRRLLGRDPTVRQQARIVDLQRKYALRSGDSIFIVVAILEVYLGDIEAACLDVRRTARQTTLRASVLALASAAVMIAPLYLFEPHIRSALGWDPVSAGTGQAVPSPIRAYIRASLDQMSEQDIARLATSRDAMTILQYLPQATERDLSAISQYLRNQATQKAQ